MKNFFKARIVPIFGIIALVAVIWFSMTACSIEIDAPNTSLDGIWTVTGGYCSILISGSNGTIGSIGNSGALWNDAISKGYVKVGDQFFRNLRSTGTLTWSGQTLTVTHYTSSNVAIGTSWINITITMSTDGKTINDGDFTWTRQ